MTQLFSPVFAHAVAHQEVTEICTDHKVWLRRKSREIRKHKNMENILKNLSIIAIFFGSPEINTHQPLWLKTLCLVYYKAF